MEHGGKPRGVGVGQQAGRDCRHDCPNRAALLSFRFWSTPQHLAATARLMRPLFDLAVAEHEFLMMELGARSYLRKTGWLILYRSEGTFAATSSERDLASEFGIPYRVLDVELLEILSLLSRRYFATWSTGKVSPVFQIRLPKHAPLRLALRRLAALCSKVTFVRSAAQMLGPWTLDVLRPLGIKLPLAIKRGYHRHFYPSRNASLARPVLDIENGYCLAPIRGRRSPS